MPDDSLTQLRDKINKMQRTINHLAILSINSRRIAGILSFLASVAIFGWINLGEATGYILAPLFVAYTIFVILLDKDLWVVLINGAIFLAFIFINIPVQPEARYGIYIMSVCVLTGGLAGIGHFQRKYQAAVAELNADELKITRLRDLVELRTHLVMLERSANDMQVYSRLLRREINQDQREKIADWLELRAGELKNLVALEDVIRQIIEQKKLVEAGE